MKKHIGESINDYVVVDNDGEYVVVECRICKHIRKMKIAEFRRVGNIHSFKICKCDYFKTNPLNGDYEFIGESNEKNLYTVRCKICGNIKLLNYDLIQRYIFNHSKANCGEQAYLYEVGKEYGDIKIVSYIGLRKNKPIYLCECKICHREKIMQLGNIKSKKGIYHKWCSMGLKNERYIKEFRSRWSNMRDRTTNKNNNKYYCYGARGISSNEFENFIDFYDCLYPSFINHVNNHGIHNTTLERVDVNKDYTKDNCTWATWKEQANNKQNTVYFKIVHKDGTEEIAYGVSEYEKLHGMSHNLIFNRLYGVINTNEYNGDLYYLIGNNKDRIEV